MKIAIKTLGCKSNRFESDRVFEELRKQHDVYELNAGVGRFDRKFGAGDTDLLIVNTCTVTNTADRKSRQAVRSFKTRNRDCKVIVFGCGVNVDPETYKKMNEVDYLAEDTDQVLKYTGEIAEKSLSFENCEYEGARLELSKGFRTRALVKIQDGCNSYCTYCIIPRARGPEFSFASNDILEEVKRKELEGFKEIVLTGINIGEWKEEGKDLADLFEMLINETKIVRFRVSSIEPKNFSEKFFELFKTGRFCPHMHMSLQSGCDAILKRMKRNYDTSEYFEICENFMKAVPDIALTTDIIVGFPGETEEEFQETCDFVRRVGFAKIHVFPYSKRAMTAACYMKNHISPDVKKERSKILREISEDLANEFKRKVIGNEYEILIENSQSKNLHGYTENYVPVEFTTEREIGRNETVKVKLLELQTNGVVRSEVVSN